LAILYLAAKESETAVDNALRILIDTNEDISKAQVQALMLPNEPVFKTDDIHIQEVDLRCYDQLFEGVI